MNNALRLLLTLFTILYCTAISGASLQESQAGVIFEEVCVSESEIGFWADFNAPKTITNPVPATMARVVPDTPITRASGTLGRPGADDIFVTAAGDIRGLNAQQIAERLTIPQSPTGFRVMEFPTPSSGVASPVFRPDPGFIGGGRTLGGAREFVIPNGPIPSGVNTTIIGP